MVILDEKIVIITGASSGIGAALARSFSSAGAKVTLAARRLNKLEEVAQSCKGDVLTITADITQEADRKAIIEKTVSKWGKIDVLVNNAGVGIYRDFIDINEADWRQLFEINLFATVFLTQEVLKLMKMQNSGLIINIASIGGLIAHSDRVVPYIASKHAIVGFSRALVRDLEGTNIKVLAACPHLTNTEFFSVNPGAQEMTPIIKKYKNFMDSPEDVAKGILEQLNSDKVIIFPTSKPAKVYEKRRDI